MGVEKQAQLKHEELIRQDGQHCPVCGSHIEPATLDEILAEEKFCPEFGGHWFRPSFTRDGFLKSLVERILVLEKAIAELQHPSK